MVASGSPVPPSVRAAFEAFRLEFRKSGLKDVKTDPESPESVAYYAFLEEQNRHSQASHS